ncbi:hypothetical protein QAD02_021399 [Eretmocerus hayati]|uniref:Uncharacterized protein n=1 Tax=Eretmocerus hayati TaxID=131215 RepID=A0ACC2PRL6_9HYME|nr:hypothetical protein QAD02_021399 [Eretmocerus hayati]
MMRSVQLRDRVMNVGAIARQLICRGVGRAARWCCENEHLDSRWIVQSVRISGLMMGALERSLGNWYAGASAAQQGDAVRMDSESTVQSVRISGLMMRALEWSLDNLCSVEQQKDSRGPESR